MSEHISVYIIVEGQTELKFVKEILAPYFAEKNIFLHPILLGGNVHFSRVINDIYSSLKERRDAFVSLFIDYYGIGNDWPGINDAKRQNNSLSIAKAINDATQKEVNKKCSDCRPEVRFISSITVHEFEGLLFSDPKKLSNGLQNVPVKSIEAILNERKGGPEMINDKPDKSPYRQLNQLYNQYKKTITGITIAKDIGVEKMREKCPVFNQWLTKIEQLKPIDSL